MAASALLGALGACAATTGARATDAGTAVPDRAPGRPVVVELAAGMSHVCARSDAGTVWCWGDRDDPRRFGGTLRPRRVGTFAGAVQLAAGGWHDCVLLGDGTARCWGANSHGQLGDGTTDFRTTPVAVVGLVAGRRLTLATAHSLAVTADGAVVGWGENDRAQFAAPADGRERCAIGRLEFSCRRTPTPLPALAQVAAIPAHWSSPCAVTTDGAVRCWGHWAPAQLAWIECPPDIVAPACRVYYPDRWPGLVALTLGLSDGCARMADGTAECWGEHAWGEPRRADADRHRPAPMPGLARVAQLALGYSAHACAARDDGTAWCWGLNGSGQLGDGSTTARRAPAPVRDLAGVVQLAAGDRFTCALTRRGAVWCWGDNRDGQLGDGTTTDRAAPVAVADLP